MEKYLELRKYLIKKSEVMADIEINNSNDRLIMKREVMSHLEDVLKKIIELDERIP